MAKKNQNKNAETQVEDGEDTSDDDKPTLTAAEKKEIGKKLFGAYEDAESNVEKAKAALDAAVKARGLACKNIHQQLGAGPFKYKGVELGKIVIRPVKSTGEETYFFRGRRNDEIESF